MSEVQLEVTSKAPSTSTRCNTQSPSQRWRRGSPKCDSIPSVLPNFSPITSRASSSHTEPDSTRYPLSSLNSSLSERDVCRICHGANGQLLSPCYCAGSMGKIHLSCLQRWLGSSNKTSCEICDFQFTLERKTKPFKQFLANPGSARDKKNMLCDMVCFCLLMPLTVTTAWLCMTNAVHLNLHVWESVGLFSLALCLLIIFTIWATICTRQNYNIWKDWSQFNQDVKLTCQPPPAAPHSQTDQPPGVRGRTQSTTVEIPIYRRHLPPSHRSSQPVRNTHCRNERMTLSPTQIGHSNAPTGGERSRNQCWSPRSGYSTRSFQDSAFQNAAVKQELFPAMRRNNTAGQRSISPVDSEQKRRQCFSPRPQCVIEGQSQRSRSPSLGNQSSDFRRLNQENMQTQCISPRSPNFVMKQESTDQISGIRSNPSSSDGSCVVHPLPSVTGSSSRSIEFIQQGQIHRSVSHHPREISATTEQATDELTNPNFYNPNQPRHSRTDGYETYV